MEFERLRAFLAESFQPAVAARMDAVLRIEVADRGLSFRVDHGTLEFDLPPGTRADATFQFRDDDTAWALLSGRGDAFEAFMTGAFRSDGYLMWAFALMAMFKSSSLPATPTE